MTEGYSQEYLAVMLEANKQGKILVFGAFDDEQGNYATQQVKLAIEGAQKLGKNYALFIFDSTGGKISSLQRFLGAIQIYKPEKDFYLVGYVSAQAYSAAFDLLQQMDWRVAHKASSLLVHYGTSGLTNFDQGMLWEKSSNALAFEKSKISMFMEMYLKRSGGKITKKQLHTLCLSNAAMTAKQAFEYGLVDEVVDTLPTSSFRPDYKLF
jgi:ATP-dependent protease ClpP protease subunit